MTFTSFTYLYFLATLVSLYWIVRNRVAKNALLLVASYLFYGWMAPWYCLLLALSTFITYGCLNVLWKTPELQVKSRWPVIIGIAANIGMLAMFKYWNFWLDDIIAVTANAGWTISKNTLRIALPLGLSFYTLQAVGLVVDAYRGDIQRQSPLSVALFLAFFPKLLAGPFEKARGFLDSIKADPSLTRENIEMAFSLLLYGYFKKLVIADNLSPYIAQLHKITTPSSTILFAISFCFAIQILADFSAYTDIARGSAKFFGINLAENFRNPYLALTPSDFWRRWHISLSQWFRDYVYIPLGGSHMKWQWQVALITICTMGLSGLWHGATANFAIWGIYYGVLLVIYRLLGMDGHWSPQSLLTRLLAWLTMTIWTLFGWLLFSMPSWERLFWPFQHFSIKAEVMSLSVSITWTFLCLIFCLIWGIQILLRKFSNRPIIAGIMYAYCIICIVILGQERMGDFVYFQF